MPGKYENQERWTRESGQRIDIKTNRKYRIKERIAQAIKDGKAESVSGYIIAATMQQLEKDGYPAPTEEENGND